MTLRTWLLGPAWTWYDVAKDFATPAIALAVGAVAFFQWLTARRKLVADLFDRRYAVYRDLHKALLMYARKKGHCPEADKLYLDAWARASFLFGDEVRSYLHEGWRKICAARELSKSRELLSALDPATEVRRVEAYDEIFRLVEPLFQLLRPYMLMKDRVPSRRWP